MSLEGGLVDLVSASLLLNNDKSLVAANNEAPDGGRLLCFPRQLYESEAQHLGYSFGVIVWKHPMRPLTNWVKIVVQVVRIKENR